MYDSNSCVKQHFTIHRWDLVAPTTRTLTYDHQLFSAVQPICTTPRLKRSLYTAWWVQKRTTLKFITPACVDIGKHSMLTKCSDVYLNKIWTFAVYRPSRDQTLYQIWAKSNQSAVELLRFNYVQFGRRPPSWIWPEVDSHNSAAFGNHYCTNT